MKEVDIQTNPHIEADGRTNVLRNLHFCTLGTITSTFWRAMRKRSRQIVIKRELDKEKGTN